MILEIPTGADFSRSSLNLLNLAWNIAAMLVRNQEALEKDDLGEWDEEGDEEQSFWHRAQIELANAYTLMQQAQEMALKGLIAEVSPYLLISDSRDWPRQCEKRDALFSEFYTPDASQLPKIHDTVASHRLEQTFLESFNNIRRIRNGFVHGVQTRSNLRPKDIFKHVLETVKFLHPGCHWFRERIRYYDNYPTRLADPPYDDPYTAILQEFDWTVDILGRKECQDLLEFHKGQRRYFCLKCEFELTRLERHFRPAQLVPNTPNSTTVCCFICGHEQQVVREDCLRENCKGNVIAYDAHGDWITTCLTCGERYDS